MSRPGSGGGPRSRTARWLQRTWALLPRWQKALGAVVSVLILGALVDGLDAGPSLAESTDPVHRAAAEFCRAQVAAELGHSPAGVVTSSDEETHVKEFGAGQFRVTLWADTPATDDPVGYLCLAMETRPGSGSFLLADLIER